MRRGIGPELLIKELIDRIFNFHKKGSQKDILIFCSRRSGSTWLMEIIGTQKGIRLLGRPFYTALYSRYRNLLPESFRNISRDIQDKGVKFIHLKEEEELCMKMFVEKLLNKKIIVHPPWNVFRRNYHFRTTRSVLQMTNEKPLINWFSNNFNIEIIFLVRHPISNSLSIIKKGWPNTCEVFLKNQYFIDKYMSEGLVNYSYELLNNGSKLEKYVLNWCLEYLVPLRYSDLKNTKWLLLSFEEVVTHTKEVIGLLSEKLNLPYKEAMYRQSKIPSKTTEKHSVNILQQNDQTKILSKWKDSVSLEMEKKAFNILSRFYIETYKFGQLLPSDPNFRHF